MVRGRRRYGWNRLRAWHFRRGRLRAQSEAGVGFGLISALRLFKIANGSTFGSRDRARGPRRTMKSRKAFQEPEQRARGPNKKGIRAEVPIKMMMATIGQRVRRRCHATVGRHYLARAGSPRPAFATVAAMDMRRSLVPSLRCSSLRTSSAILVPLCVEVGDRVGLGSKEVRMMSCAGRLQVCWRVVQVTWLSS